MTVNNAYSEADRPSSELEVLRKWKAQLAERRDAADSEWRREKRSLGFVLHYLYDGRPRVDAAWAEILRGTDQFEQCTRDWYVGNAAKLTALKPDRICPEQRAAFEQAVQALTSATSAEQK